MATEDLTTYTEVDVAGNRVAVTTAAATVTDLDRDENVNVYKDFTAGHFDALDIDFEFNFTGASHGTLTAFAGTICLTAAVETQLSGFATTDLMLRLTILAGPAYRIDLVRGNGVAVDASSALSTDTIYYCTITRAAGNDSISCAIYSDSGRTTLVDTITVAGFSTTTWQYLYAVFGVNDAVTARAIDYVVQNIDLHGELLHLMPAGAIVLTGIAFAPQLTVAMPAGAVTLTGVEFSRYFPWSMPAGAVTISGVAFVLTNIDYIKLSGKPYDTGLSGMEYDFSLTGKGLDTGLSGQTYDFSLTGKPYDTGLTGQHDE